MSKLQKKPSALKRGHPTLQNMNFYTFISTSVGHFWPPGSGSGSRIRIRIHWPDWIRIQFGSGSETLNWPGFRIRIRSILGARSWSAKKWKVWSCGNSCGFASLRSKMSNLYPDPDPHQSEKPNPDQHLRRIRNTRHVIKRCRTRIYEEKTDPKQR